MITSIRLQNFRSYKDSSFEFTSGVNIIVGPNASGKTNLLEAVLVLAAGKSYKSRDIDLVRTGKKWSRLDGSFGNQARTLKLKEVNGLLSKQFEIDSKLFKRLSLEKNVPTVLFEPNHLQLISRGPEARRDYIDLLLQNTNPEIKTTLSKYKRTLAQRNSLLKQPRTDAKKQLFVWDVRLSELGGKIAAARQILINDINKQISYTYSKIAGKKAVVSLKYDAQFPINQYASKMLSKLQMHADLDFDRGFTAHGPHREDILFYLDGSLASLAASRGEARSILLALKIFELGLVEEHFKTPPILLLDDVFSELDTNRRRSLVGYLKNHQVLITTTDADTVIDHFTEQTNILPLK